MSKVFTVAAYSETREYGGPEEGGWWYNLAQLIRPLKMFKSFEAAERYADRLTERLNSPIGPNHGRRSKYSVIGDPEVCVKVCEERVPAQFPEERPYYC